MLVGSIITFIFVVLVASYAIASSGLLADIGNPLAQLLGLQDAPTPHTLENKFGKVIEITDGRIRVEYQGTTWFARSNAAEVEFQVGDTVKVVGREGLTLLVKSISV